MATGWETARLQEEFAPVENKGTGCSELHAVLLQQSSLKEE